MERRHALKAIVFFSIAANSIVSCKSNAEAASQLGLKNIHPDDGQLNLIDEVSKLIFPTTSLPQYKDHTAMPFVLTMVDGIYTKDERDQYIKGIKAFEDLAKTTFQKSYTDFNAEQKMELLKKLNSASDKSDAKYFFDVTKQQTLHYFTHTEEYMRNVQKYEMAPGRFKGCLPLDQIQSKKL